MGKRKKKQKILSVEEIFKTFGPRPFEALGIDMNAGPAEFAQQLTDFNKVVNELFNDQKLFEGKDPKTLEQHRKGKELATYAVESVFKRNLTPRQSLCMTDDQIESIYYYGKMFYENGRYQQAITLFKQLTAFDPRVARYHFSLAASYHQNNQLDYALASYLTAATLKPTDPLPFYHAADCMIRRNDIGSALVFLQSAIQVSGDQPEYEEIKKESAYIYDVYWALLLEQEKQKPAKAKKEA